MTKKPRVTVESKSTESPSVFDDSRPGTRIPSKKIGSNTDYKATLDEFESLEEDFVKSYHPHTKTMSLGEYYDNESEFGRVGKSIQTYGER